MDFPDVYPVDGNFGSLGRLSSHGRTVAIMASSEDSPNRTDGMRDVRINMVQYTPDTKYKKRNGRVSKHRNRREYVLTA